MSILRTSNRGSYLPISAPYLASLGYTKISTNGRYNIWQSPKYYPLQIKEENGVFTMISLGSSNHEYLIDTINKLHNLESVFAE